MISMLLKAALLIVTLLGCPSNVFFSQDQENVGERFRDIDLFASKGIDKIKMGKRKQFPFFEIFTNNEDERTVIAHYSKTKRIPTVYKQIGSLWFNFRVNYGDSINHRCTYTYVLSDRIIKLKFLHELPSNRRIETDPYQATLNHVFNTKSHYLLQIEILSAEQRVVYNYDGLLIDQEPSPELGAAAKGLPYLNIFKEVLKIEGNVMKSIQGIVHKGEDAKDDYVVSVCYQLVDRFGYKHNNFWITEFGMGNEVECK